MQTITGQGAGALDVPFPTPEGVQAELLNDLRNTHHAHILLVGQNQKHGILQLVLSQHLLQLFPGDFHSLLV